MKKTSALLITLVLLLCAGCSGGDAPLPYYDAAYFRDNAAGANALDDLFSLLDDETAQGRPQRSPDGISEPNSSSFNTADIERFALVREIASRYARADDYSRLAVFLTQWVAEHPDDPYNTYYLFMTAWAYTKLDAYPVAALYFDQIVKNFPDLYLKNRSIHLKCLRELIILEERPEAKIRYYEEILSRFGETIGREESAQVWFMLGQAFEKTGQWQRAIEAYSAYISEYNLVIPGFPNAYNYAKQMIDFSKSDKSWTFASLADLLRTIEGALDAGNVRSLSRYRAKVNFFTRSWAQEESDATDDTGAEFNLSTFQTNAALHYDAELSSGSNANEAYLKTWGWAQFTSIWYFYFRKIYYPPDPEIHGRWEWAGIYYGEKF